MWEIVIKGKFVTGTTIDDEEQAKRLCKKLLEDKLADAGIEDEKVHGLFQWIPESVEAERL
ncbi:unnamed protein product [marine sediment metagenome]|uniref:Uncharacterized protein n=1 Tax=marine sediment metagenome TaxID=412755 RepID=X1TWV1_9ZZZZ